MTSASEVMTLTEFAAWWNDPKDPKVATSAATLADWKGDIEKLCSMEQVCTAPVLAQVNAFYAKVSAAHAMASRASGGK